MSEHTATNQSNTRVPGNSHLEYDRWTETYRAEYDWSNVTPSTAVIETVAAIEDTEPTDLEPLYGHVDSDALDALITAEGARSTTSVTFEFAADTVTVHGDGTIAVHCPEGGSQ